MKYLITGCSGFVAKHLVDHISAMENESTFLGIDLVEPLFEYHHEFSNINLLDSEKLQRQIEKFKPDYILHLASFSSVAKSWNFPKECFSNNTNIFLNLVEAVRTSKVKTRILSIGSSEEYGIVDKDMLPLKETHTLRPISPYAVARVAQEQLSIIYSNSYSLDIVITRSFNHVGTGQLPVFVIPSIVKQFASCAPNTTCTLTTGDLSIVRDFLDVRDVARAYYQLLKKGKSGEVYNVCSGKGHSIHEVINLISKIANKPYSIQEDPAFMRPNDNPVIIGSYEKLNQCTGWIPEIPLQDSLEAIYSSFVQE